MSGQLLKGVSHDDYHSDALPGSPRLSRSIAVKLLSQSPLHAWQAHPKLGGAPAEGEDEEEDESKKKRLAMGSLLHSLLLGSGQPITEIYIHGDRKKGQVDTQLYPASNFKTAEARELRDKARQIGRLPVIPHVLEEARVTASAIRSSLLKYGVELHAYETEATCLWDSNGVACKARMDGVMLAAGEVLDVKVQDRINLRSFEYGVPAYGLHIQAGAYLEGLETVHPAIAGRTKFRFLLCERFQPYDVAIVQLAPAYLDLGLREWHRARDIWAPCLESDIWPGFGVQAPIEPRPYQLEADFSKSLEAAGEPAWAKETE